MNNIGLLYNKDYFKGISYRKDGSFSFNSSNVMNHIQNFRLQDFDNYFKASNSFKLQTIYPGLLHGAGYQHEIGGQDNEFKLGVYFDYTSGLPVITGSAIKGILRAACESRKGYISEILNNRLKLELPNDFDESNFIKTVFEGKDTTIYKRDIFFEAVPIYSQANLLGNDFITPHKNPLKDPNPIQFLRVDGQVTYLFQFDLKGSNGLTTENKLELFKQLILDIGVGAKTNVGYGQFQELSKEERVQQQTRSYQAFEGNRNSVAYKNQDIINVKIIHIDEHFTLEDEHKSIYMKSKENVLKYFEKTLKRKQKKNPEIKFKELKEGMTIQIRFNHDLDVSSTEVNFTVLPVIEKKHE